jgi:hypothetical protein
MVTVRPAEGQVETDTVLGLVLPLDVYWEVTELLRSVDYMVSINEPAAKVNELYMKVFRKVAPFAINDKDRTWFYDKIQGKTPSPADGS